MKTITKRAWDGAFVVSHMLLIRVHLDPRVTKFKCLLLFSGYFHDNLYVVVLMCIFIVSCGDLGGSHYDSCHMDACSRIDHLYMLGTMQGTPSLNICW